MSAVNAVNAVNAQTWTEQKSFSKSLDSDMTTPSPPLEKFQTEADFFLRMASLREAITDCKKTKKKSQFLGVKAGKLFQLF